MSKQARKPTRKQLEKQLERLKIEKEQAELEASIAGSNATKTEENARKTEAEVRKAEASRAKLKSNVKKGVFAATVATLLGLVGVTAYKAKKGVSDGLDAVSGTIEATAKLGKEVARVTNSTADFVKDHTSDPDLAAYLIKAKEQKPIRFVRSESTIRFGQAESWSITNPELPLTGDQLKRLLDKNEQFNRDNGRYMNNEEAIKAREKLIKGEHHTRLLKGSKEGTSVVALTFSQKAPAPRIRQENHKRQISQISMSRRKQSQNG